jgi:hypothetical protein
MDIYSILEKLAVISNKQTLTEGQMKRSLEARAEKMSKADFVANAGEYGMSAEEAAEFWSAVNGEDDDLNEADATGQFEPGDRVMYLNTFATVVKCDGDTCGIRVDGRPGTMMVAASQLKKPSYDESVAEGEMEEGNAFSGAVAKAKADGVQPGEKIKVGGKEYPVKEAKKSKPDFLDIDRDGDRKEPMKKAAREKQVNEVTDAELDAQAVAQRKRQMATAKNSRAVQSQPAAGAKRADIPAALRKARGDAPLSKDELSEVFPGTTEYELRFGKDDAASAFDKKKISTGTVYSRKHQEEPESDDDAPRAAGRPKGAKRRLGAKGPGVDSKLLKGKGGLKEQDINPADHGEYDREGDMALNQLHQIADAAEELHSILDANENLPEWVQSKITKAVDYLDTARDYLKAKGDQAHEMIPEKAVSRAQQQAAGAALAAKRGGGKAIGASKEMAKMSTKELEKFASTKHKGLPKKVSKVEEESTDTRDDRAERAGKRVAKDIEYDEKKKDSIHGQRRGAEDNKAEKAGKKVAKDIEHDEKVDETTVAGSVATGGEAPKSKGGMQFGKGVYEGALAESFEKKMKQLTEGMNLTVSTDDQGQRNISVSATGADADSLGDMLKMAGLFSSEGYSRTCESCHGIHEAGACQKEQVEEELANSPDEQYSDADTMLNTLSGGLNGPKLQVNPNNMGDNPLAMRNLGKGPSGQVNLGDIAEGIEKESTTRLWDLYKGYKAK